MPIAPRVRRVTPRGVETRYPDADRDPQPCPLVLRWQGGTSKVELVPAYRVGEAVDSGSVTAVLVRWWWAPRSPDDGVYREDWLDPRDVLDHEPDAEKWAALVERGVLG